MLATPDYISPALGIPVAVVLWAVWVALVIRDRKKAGK